MNFVRINGFPDYVIHPCGTVLKIWKNHTREMKPWKHKDGYIQIALTNNGKRKKFYIHRLLALHFIPNDDPENKPCIDHLDAVRDNNNLNNLEWVTYLENNRRMLLNNPRIPAEITKGCIWKHGNSWKWQYLMKGKKKTKTMKSKQDLLKFRKELLIKYNINL
jgi:hypothetical protein